MGQTEVLEFLNKERKFNDKWFRVKDIQKGLKNKGINNIHQVGRQLVQLAGFGFIEWRGVGVFDHHKEFRGKKEETEKNGD